VSLSFDGTTMIFEGTVTLTNATDLTTGVATLMLTPAGGVGVLPALIDGPPGLPPVFDAITVTQVPYGTAVAAPVLTQVSPGGFGVASHYTLAIQLNSGQQGPTGTSTISGSTDIEGTPVDKYILVYDAANSAWQVTAQKVGGLYMPGTINSSAGSNTSRVLASMTIPAQPFAWRPLVFGQCIVSGTSNTRVDLLARIANADTGDQVGRAFGVAGATPPPAIIIPAYGGSLGGTTYGEVAANTAATIYYTATQQNSSTADSWSTSAATTSFMVQVQPLV
jgi:hypothetical protein